MQSFDGHLLDKRLLMIDLEELVFCIDQQHHVVSSKGLLDVIGLLIDIDAPIGADATREGLPMNVVEKADPDRPDLVWPAVWATSERRRVEADLCRSVLDAASGNCNDA